MTAAAWMMAALSWTALKQEVGVRWMWGTCGWAATCLAAGDDELRWEKNPGRDKSLRKDVAAAGDDLADDSERTTRGKGEGGAFWTAEDGVADCAKKAAAAATAAAPATFATRTSSTDADTCNREAK